MFRKIGSDTHYKYNDIGYKAFNCQTLMNYGFNCPDGFVITNELTELDEIEILNVVNEDCYYAVRSSMTDEDTKNNSCAGQYLTELAVTKDEILQQIRNVIHSGNKKTNRCALVQPLIFSEASGVLFTSDPIRNSGRTIINSYIASGENVVSGMVDPDYFELENDSIVTRKISHKKGAILYGCDSIVGEKHNLNGVETRTTISTKGCSLETILLNSCNKPSLTDEQIMEVYKNGKILRELVGKELDIEFVVNKDGIFFTQMRPITTEGVGENVVYGEESSSNKIIGEVVSTGYFEGPVVYDDGSTNEFFEEKVILVTHELTPDLLKKNGDIGAIVTAKGGVLSHGAILAREKKIPCITGLNNKIELLKASKYIKVNANLGEIYYDTFK